VVVQTGVVIAAGGDWMHFYRFFVPVLPVIAAGCAAGLGIILQMNHQIRKWPLLVVLAGTLAAAYVNIYKVERATGREVMPHVKSGTYLTDGYRQTAQWIVDNTPPGSSVALCDIGLVGYFSERPIVDMFGLIDPHISHLNGRQHFKSDPEYVLGKHPDVVVLVSSGIDEFIRIPDAQMFVSPDFVEKYNLVKTIPIGFRSETVRIYRSTF
jgi:arabinofuranosyltransferase